MKFVVAATAYPLGGSMDRYEEFTAYVRTHRREIIRRWNDDVRTAVEAFKSIDQLALGASLNELIDDLATALSQPTKAHDLLIKSDSHKRLRSNLQEFSLAQVLAEYNVLRRSIFEELDARFDLSSEERNFILDLMAQAASEAASAFFEVSRASDHQGRIDAEGARDLAQSDAMQLVLEMAKARRSAKAMQDERDQTRVHAKNLEAEHGLKDRFIATLSHDLRSPIGAAKMALEILALELPETASVQDLLSLMNRNLDRANCMIRDLLDAHRIKSGYRLPLEIERCNLTSLARETCRELAATYGSRFVLDANQDVFGYWCEEKLRRLIENLASNAVKYGDGVAPIRIGIAQDELQTTVTVHNFGKPIPPDEQASLFEPFYRALHTDSGPSSGWGLGLALVRGVADAHGGHVDVRSTAAEGTTFTINLPNDARPFHRHQARTAAEPSLSNRQ